MSKQKKIVIPTEEEIAELTGKAPAERKVADAAGRGPVPEQASTDQTAAPQAAETGAEPQARSEADEFKDKYLRARAELANYQRRVEKNREEMMRYVNAELIKALLPVLDNLERVIGSAEKHANNSEAIINGAKLTLESLRKVLRDFGATVIEAQDQPFDPVQHEAVMQQPSDQHPDQTVVQVLQNGYRLYDRVLRPAKVVVSKAPVAQTAEPRAAEED